VIGILVAGGVGAGVWAATRGDATPTAAPDPGPIPAPAPDPGPTNPDPPPTNPDPPPGPVSPDFSTPGRRDFYGDTGNSAPAGEVFNHPVGFQLIVPPGFTHAGTTGMDNWTGNVGSAVVVVTLVGLNTGAMNVGTADYDTVGTSMAGASGGRLIEKGYAVFNGVQRPTGIVDMAGQRAQYVIYHQAPMFIVMTAMTTPEAFDSTAAFRRELFDHRLRLSSSSSR
jgi:hypothetical protein